MGTDNLHQKRKARKLSDLRRRAPKRDPYDRIFIVSEGTETEPNYFKGLREHLRLNPQNVVICSCPCGTDPKTIVTYAENEQKAGDYDRVYCVFDKENANYQIALEKIDNIDGLYAITSVPCFEYWLLLHFEDSTRPYEQKGKKTPGQQLKSAIKKYLPKYTESDKAIFEKTAAHLGVAITRAEKIDKAQQRSGTDNPSTKVYELVRYLIQLSERI